MRDRCKTSDTFSSAWQAWRFLHVAKTLASVHKIKGCFWMSFFGAGAVFGELGRRFERVENRVFVKLSSNLIWDMMMIPCGRRRTSDASGSFFVADTIFLCRP